MTKGHSRRVGFVNRDLYLAYSIDSLHDGVSVDLVKEVVQRRTIWEAVLKPFMIK